MNPLAIPYAKMKGETPKQWYSTALYTNQSSDNTKFKLLECSWRKCFNRCSKSYSTALLSICLRLAIDVVESGAELRGQMNHVK